MKPVRYLPADLNRLTNKAHEGLTSYLPSNHASECAAQNAAHAVDRDSERPVLLAELDRRVHRIAGKIRSR